MFFFRMNFLDVLISIFVSSPKQKKYCSACGGLRPPNPSAGASPPAPLDPLLTPIHPLFPPIYPAISD